MVAGPPFAGALRVVVGEVLNVYLAGGRSPLVLDLADSIYKVLTTPQPNLLSLKKAQAIWRGVLTAEVLKFPKEKHDVALTLLKAATRLEKSSPEGCIALQRRAIALMPLELKQARYAAYAAEKALEEVVDS